MAFTTAKINALKSKNKPYKVSDFDGLYILVNPTGSRLWRFKYRRAGKEKLLSLGAYPAVGLREARLLRDEARANLAKGLDPAVLKKKRKRRSCKTLKTLFPLLLRNILRKRKLRDAPPQP